MVENKVTIQLVEDQIEEIKNPPKFKEGHLLLSGDGIFYTVQGEGASVGFPAIFVRLHMCNLACDWSKSGGEICDAWYTWKKDTKEYQTEHHLIDFFELRDKILTYPGERIVFTGGEPLMQQQHINEFLEGPGRVFLGGHVIEIETNGSYKLAEKTSLFRSALKSIVQINCSPKLSNAGNKSPHPYSYEALEQFNQLPLSYFKFVVSDHKDIEEISAIAKSVGIISDKIIIMPEGTSNEKIAGQRMLDLIEIAKMNNWRISPRLQCEVWGNKRGV